MWEKRNFWAVGGLLHIGFKPNTDLLLVCSSQGRGVFDCVSGEKLARDRNQNHREIYVGDTCVARGIGPLEGEEIRCGGFEYPDVLSKETNDGWIVEVRKEMRKNWEGESIVEVEVMYLRNKKTHQLMEMSVFYYGIDRGYGFSETGKSFVIGISSDIRIWSRRNL